MVGKMSGIGKSIAPIVSNPVSIKLIAIGIITLLLLKPASMIQSLIDEREDRQTSVVSEISSKWGAEQTITGPIISVPYKTASNSTHYMNFLPTDLLITGNLKPKVLHRGIFDAVVYKAGLQISGVFTYPDIEKLKVSPNSIDWSGASVSLGVSDVRGIKDKIIAQINSKETVMNPGLLVTDVISSGVSAMITLDPRYQEYRFKFQLDLAGSERISFIPLGKSTTVKLSSNWPSPNFDGAYLPQKREITDKGFNAMWKVLDLNRDYPQQWLGAKFKEQTKESAFSVGLVTPVDFYRKSMRTTKYASLFVVLIFTAFFISEMVAQVRLHPIQYLLIGIAVITFYILLLSLSEHINFRGAYLISSASIIALVSLYAWSILNSSRLAAIVCGALSVIYGYLYWLLQMVDYALLVGSIGLFAALSVIMYVTRKIDWYSLKVNDRMTEENSDD